MKIKYYKLTCSYCREIYTVNLDLSEKQIFCYKCGAELKFPNTLAKEKIDFVNSAMNELEKIYKIEPDGDGLVLSSRISFSPATAGERVF